MSGGRSWLACVPALSLRGLEMSTITELNPRLLAFGTLIAAQAAGDLETLRWRGLPAERVEVGGDPADAVRSLTARITRILQES
jgi:hypothetical protein